MEKKVFSTFSGLALINALNILVPIITMPYLSRVLTPHGYGLFLLFSSVYVFSFIIMDYSSNITGVRAIAIEQNKTIQTKIFCEVQSLRLIFGVVSGILSSIYIAYTIGSTINLSFIIINVVITHVGYYLTASWYHQGTQNMIAVAVISFLARGMQLVVLFFFVNTVEDLKLAIISITLSFFLMGIIIELYRRKTLNLYFRFKSESISKNFKNGFDTFIGDFAPNLYSNLPPLLIGLTASPAAFAAYSLSMRIINIAGSFQLMFAKAVYPSVVNGKASFKKIMIYNIGVSFFPILIIYFFGGEVIKLFLGSGYDSTVIYLKWLAPSILFAAVVFSLTYGFFLPRKLDKIFRNVSLIASFLSALIGYACIYYVGAIGAIIMFVLARLLFVLLFTYNYFKLKNVFN
ncbi:oligosaccharide flippase family protein [Cronobacter turicensis]|nr:oligosaccharide flippase family protein [Cronobacter turicensis]